MALFINVNMQCALVNACTGIGLVPNPFVYGNPGQYNNINAYFPGVILLGAVNPGPYLGAGGTYQNVTGQWSGPAGGKIA